MNFNMNKYLIALIILLTSILGGMYGLLKKERKERHRASINLEASLSELSEYKTKLGETVAIAKGYELKVNELERLLPDLYSTIKELKVKTKNIQTVVEVKTEYKYINRDIIVPVFINDTTKLYTITDEWLKAQFRITRDTIQPNDFEILSIPNTQHIVSEATYRGWWFWRKATGINVHIKNTNPHLTTQEAAFIKLLK